MSKEILSQEEIDALLEGLGQEENGEEENSDSSLQLIELAASNAQQEGFPVQLDSWEAGNISSEDILKVEFTHWGQIEITGTTGGRALYYVTSECCEIWEEVAEAEEDIEVGDLIQFFADTLAATVASNYAEATGQVIDLEPAPQEGDPSEIVSNLQEWYQISIHFDASGDVCSLNILWPGEELDLLAFDEEQYSHQDSKQDESVDEEIIEQVEDESYASKESPQTSSRSSRQSRMTRKKPKKVQKAEFPAFDSDSTASTGDSRLDMLLDVPLQISVELGRTESEIKEVLNLGTGSVLELEKQAGDPVDVLVNGKLMARGEVVVVDENFAVRITEIVSLEDRLNNLR